MAYRRTLVPGIVGILTLIVILWSQVGLTTNITLFEGWDALSIIISGDRIVPAADPWVTRPLRWIPHWIAYSIADGAPLGYNIYLVTLFIIRITAVFISVWLIVPDRPQFAFAVAVVWLIYPAGNGFYNFRALTTHAALTTSLVSICLLLLYWRNPRRWLWIPIWLVQLAALLTHENLYAPLGLAPVLLLFASGWQRRQRWLKVSALWYLFYTIAALWVFVLLLTGSAGYLTNRAEEQADEEPVPELLETTIANMYTDHAEGWQLAVEQIDTNTTEFGLALIAGLLVAGISYVMFTNDEEPISNRIFAIGLIMGLLFMLGYFILYAPIAPRASQWRVYFSSSLAASAVVVILVYWVGRYFPLRKIWLSLITGILVVIGLPGGLAQNQETANRSAAVKEGLSAVVENNPVMGDEIIVIIDDELMYQGQFRPFIRSSYFSTAFRYLYDIDEASAFTCVTQVNRQEICEFTPDGILHTVRRSGEETLIPYDMAVIFASQPNGTVQLWETIPADYWDTPIDYNPQPFLEQNTDYPPRVDHYFTCFPRRECKDE